MPPLARAPERLLGVKHSSLCPIRIIGRSQRLWDSSSWFGTMRPGISGTSNSTPLSPTLLGMRASTGPTEARTRIGPSLPTILHCPRSHQSTPFSLLGRPHLRPLRCPRRLARLARGTRSSDTWSVTLVLRRLGLPLFDRRAVGYSGLRAWVALTQSQFQHHPGWILIAAVAGVLGASIDPGFTCCLGAPRSARSDRRAGN